MWSTRESIGARVGAARIRVGSLEARGYNRRAFVRMFREAAVPSFRCALLASLALGSVALAQIQIDDRPKVLEDAAPITKEELNRRQAEQLLRDAQAKFGVGIFRQRHETLIEAVTILEKALTLDPESLEIRRTLIPLYSTIGRDDN